MIRLFNEFGVSLAVLAARQVTAAWGRQGVLERHLPRLSMRLSDLVDEGAIGHPTDIVDITGFVRASGNTPAGQQLVTHVKESADTIGRVTTDFDSELLLDFFDAHPHL